MSSTLRWKPEIGESCRFFIVFGKTIADALLVCFVFSFVILGTDGLWDYIPNDEAVKIVHDGMLHGLKEADVAMKLVDRALTIAAEESGMTLAEL
jgi:hypothetical protein